MSRGQLARTPENFPRMKHRAAGRLAKRKAAQEAPNVFAVFAEVADRVAKGITALAEGFARLFGAPQKQNDYILWPPPIIKQQFGPLPTNYQPLGHFSPHPADLERADDYERNDHQ